MTGSDQWKSMNLGDLIDIKHGFAFQGEFFCDDNSGDILLTPGNFAIGGGFKADKFKYYVGPVPEDYVLNEGDLLVTMTDLSKESDTLGFPAIIPKSKGPKFLHNQRLGKILIKDITQLDRRFLYYLMCTKEYRQEVISSATGTTVKHTSPTRILAYNFLLPPFDEQQRITNILGSFDDKIDINRQINETLEILSRTIFQSWFIDFDPVRAKVDGRQPEGMDSATAVLFSSEFEEIDDREIPKGWTIATLPEIFEINPQRSLGKDQIAPYLDMQNVPTRGHRPIDWVSRAFSSGTKFVNGDTLLARITPCLENGKTIFVDFLSDGQVGWGSTEYIVLRPKQPLPPEFGYLLARDDEFRAHAILNMSGSSGRQRVPSKCFDSYQIVVPTKAIAEKFGEIAKILLGMIKQNDEQSRNLITLRDSLSPRLMSGEIPVKT